ncbi:site-specific integrase [Xylophilus sp. GOD-11R]|uniref:tyrosine-type recombinase/integrase n=1 Tax=Xylophilus sp. GOD-11R TaxID=3089814 RepID=UPI00298CF46D|nr:site-specific integrase [Xylophilus sp. GOD-11R]WPB57389.1 site-specific integrase [Xylophilus sp. GOD-11R]
MLRSRVTDGRIFRDRMLSGFVVRMNARKRTFRVITSVAGKHFRMNLGYWPLMSVDEARAAAMEVLRQCRKGAQPVRPTRPKALPTLREACAAYCTAKAIKDISRKRYNSLFQVHFGDWLDRPVKELAHPEFFDHCQAFAASKGASIVELGRGVLGAVLKYVNVLHDIDLVSPFSKLAVVGLMPDRATPRTRMLQDADLPAWRAAVDTLDECRRDFLLFSLYTGLRRNECRELRLNQIDAPQGVLTLPMTKNGKPHSLPITPLMRTILVRRMAGLSGDEELFPISASHLTDVAARAGAPSFRLHDLRKLLATTGERLGVGDASIRRVLNHSPPCGDVLHRHYVQLTAEDVRNPLVRMQEALEMLMCPKECAKPR